MPDHRAGTDHNTICVDVTFDHQAAAESEREKLKRPRICWVAARRGSFRKDHRQLLMRLNANRPPDLTAKQHQKYIDDAHAEVMTLWEAHAKSIRRSKHRRTNKAKRQLSTFLEGLTDDDWHPEDITKEYFDKSSNVRIATEHEAHDAMLSERIDARDYCNTSRKGYFKSSTTASPQRQFTAQTRYVPAATGDRGLAGDEHDLDHIAETGLNSQTYGPQHRVSRELFMMGPRLSSYAIAMATLATTPSANTPLLLMMSRMPPSSQG